MNQLELKAAIEAILPKWKVTVDEADMVNVIADSTTKPFVYIEEFDFVTDSAATFGMKRTRKEEIYVVMFTEMHNNGEKRVALRETVLRPALDAIQALLCKKWGVKTFMTDPMPRGFDANEILLHTVFEYTEQVC